MEERRQAFHEDEDGEREAGPEPEQQEDCEAARGALYPHAQLHHHVPEHLRELRVGQRQGPEPEVGGGVRHGAQHVLDGVDALVDEHVGELLLGLVAAGGGLGGRGGHGAGLGVPAVGRGAVLLDAPDVVVEQHVLLALVADDDERLRQEHPRHADHRQDHQQFLESALERTTKTKDGTLFLSKNKKGVALTLHRPAMPFGNSKIYFKGSFQFSFVII